MSVVEQSRASLDRYATLLRQSLQVLSQETVSKWLAQLEADLLSPDVTEPERLEVNAMLVGVLTVMLDAIDTAKLEGR